MCVRVPHHMEAQVWGGEVTGYCVSKDRHVHLQMSLRCYIKKHTLEKTGSHCGVGPPAQLNCKALDQ